MNHDHAVSGMRPSVMPGARSVSTVTSTLMAHSQAPMQNSPMLTIQASIPGPIPGPAEATALMGG